MKILKNNVSVLIILSFIFYGCEDKLQVKQTIDYENLYNLLSENDDFIKFTNSNINNIILINNMPKGEREEFLMDVENLNNDNDIIQLIQLFKIKKIETKVFHWYSKTKEFLSDNYIYDEIEFEEIAIEIMMLKYDAILGGNFRTSKNDPTTPPTCTMLCAVSSSSYRDHLETTGLDYSNSSEEMQAYENTIIDGMVFSYWLGCFQFCEEQ